MMTQGGDLIFVLIAFPRLQDHARLVMVHFPYPMEGNLEASAKISTGRYCGSAGARLGIQHAGGFFNSPSVAGVASTPTQASDERNLGISVDAMLGPMSQARHVRCGSQVGRGSLRLMSAGGDSALVR